LLKLTGGISGLVDTTQFLALSLVLGALATATAPAGTVAVIKEYKAKGNLTQTLYAVVGYDDALAVIFFGFALATAHSLLSGQTGETSTHLLRTLLAPLKEIFLSFLVGGIIGGSFSVLTRKLKRLPDMLILIVGFTLIANGLSAAYHLSFILTNMVFGFIVINTQPLSLVERVRNDLGVIMPLLFIFLFGLAGAHMDVRMLPKLGLLGVVYVASRSAGKVFGVHASSLVGRLESKIKKYLGIGLLSQAGVAIGLALVASQELRGIGITITHGGGEVAAGTIIGSMVMATIMASSIFFEIVGPILVKVALQKAGEIPSEIPKHPNTQIPKETENT
jgi:NhaP-type Na+/H+ or K+/H+ antiporter